MLALIRRPIGPGGRHRGVTLVEMLVVVALVVLMMVILVQIFQSATGAMSASRTNQELDVVLRQVDSTIRSDLAGVTAKMTPPNDPKDKRGYFELGENAPADLQGEDGDDYMAFTTRAPEGQVFTGRQWLGPDSSGNTAINQNVQPTAVTSQVAEVIYFLRNGNLYRRVFLVAPDRAKSISAAYTATLSGNYYTSMFGGYTYVSWQGMNDISCRPGGFSSAGAVQSPIPNDLGDLTNRENRAFHPRFFNDFTSSSGGNPDGAPDDGNANDVPDYYPTLYTDGSNNHGNAPNRFTFDFGTSPGRVSPGSYNVYAFPFIYPGMYSVADRFNTAYGWVHHLYTANHAPLETGDNLGVPSSTQYQTWWGFPTWRETMAGSSTSPARPGWTDPINFLTRSGNTNGYFQPLGLQPFDPTKAISSESATILSNLLPPVGTAETGSPEPFTNPSPSYTNNQDGSASFITIPAAPTRVWEDDLLLTGVRSFDIKVYDENAPLYNTPATTPPVYFSGGYQDLGYGSASYAAGAIGLSSTNDLPWQSYGSEPVGFGHEGRIPPNGNDLRIDPRRPQRQNTQTGAFHPNFVCVDDNGNGEDSAGVIRLVRVWDSWSTDYTNAPASDIFLNQSSQYSQGIYPAFPAPYPSPLRGIQIQIRLVDPRGEKAKSITIRHDFTDKL